MGDTAEMLRELRAISAEYDDMEDKLEKIKADIAILENS